MRTAWQRLSLRARLLLIGVVGVATALAVGGAALYGVLSVLSYRYLDDAAAATAADVVALVEAHRLPDPIPATGNQIVQVVDARGRVVSASVNGDRLTTLLLPGEIRSATESGSPVEVPGSRMGLSSPLRVTVAAAGSSTVLVAQQPADVVHSRHLLGLTLLGLYPVLLAVLALIAWRVVGAALRPVESLRASAERISGAGREERLPVPKSRDEIRALAVTLNSMLDRLADSRARQRAFVDDAAHELRSPLSSMLAQLDVAERLGDDELVTADLRAEVVRMAALVEDLLTLARMDAGGAVPGDADTVDLRDLVAEVAGRYVGRAVPVVACVDGPVPALVRYDELRRALTNLVDNALRFARSVVEVTASDEGDEVVLDVSDDGPGIPPSERERVFERFARLDDARARDAGGTGLGLAIVKELVARNGGTVRVRESALGGAGFQLVLPRAVRGAGPAR